MNLDQKISSLIDHILYDEDRPLRVGEKTFAERLKHLIRDVVEDIKPARLESNLEHVHKVDVVDIGIVPVATSMHAYNAAIDDMETKMEEIGL